MVNFMIRISLPLIIICGLVFLGYLVWFGDAIPTPALELIARICLWLIIVCCAVLAAYIVWYTHKQAVANRRIWDRDNPRPQTPTDQDARDLAQKRNHFGNDFRIVQTPVSWRSEALAARPPDYDLPISLRRQAE